MCLVLNKIDRLVIIRQMDGEQIYHQLTLIIEEINSIIAELIKADFIDQGQNFDEVLEAKESELFFDPAKGNVAFASAYDCWSFSLPSFLPNVAQKLGMNAKALQKFMWGDYYFANKQVTKVPPTASSKIMFVQFIMDPLVEKYNKIFSKEVLKNTALIREAHVKIKEKLSKLMPTEYGIFKMVIDNLPSPI